MDSTIRSTRFVAIDFESAGVRPGGTDWPVQVGLAVMENLLPGSSPGFVSYISCPEPVTWKARQIHGITDEDLEQAPALLDLWPRLNACLRGSWVVAHGAATEKRFLRAFPLHGFGPWVDTLKVARALDPAQPSHALGDLATAYALDRKILNSMPDARWHDAGTDALASLVVLQHLIVERGLADLPPEVLLNLDDSAFHRSRQFPPPR